MKILIVEDEVRISDFIKKGLEMENFTVERAFDGEEALRFISAGCYDAIIMDIMLPKMTGLEVTRELRRLEMETPVIILTARDSDRDQVAGFESGADHYLIKPFLFSELIARLNALIRRKNPGFGEPDKEDFYAHEKPGKKQKPGG